MSKLVIVVILAALAVVLCKPAAKGKFEIILQRNFQMYN